MLSYQRNYHQAIIKLSIVHSRVKGTMPQGSPRYEENKPLGGLSEGLCSAVDEQHNDLRPSKGPEGFASWRIDRILFGIAVGLRNLGPNLAVLCRHYHHRTQEGVKAVPQCPSGPARTASAPGKPTCERPTHLLAFHLRGGARTTQMQQPLQRVDKRHEQHAHTRHSARLAPLGPAAA